jgi:hypothetical protein
MQPINRVLLLLIFIGAATYYWFQQQAKIEYERQIGALSSALDRRYLSTATPAAQAESMFLRALVIFADYRTLVTRGRIKIGEETYLQDSLKAAGYFSDNEIALVAKTLRENLNLCQQMKIITESEGTQTLLSGQNPIIRAGPFKGDTLILGRRLAPVLAPDLANHPANYALLPATSAALIWPFTLSEATLDAVREFKANSLLDSNTATDLQKRADQIRKLAP